MKKIFFISFLLSSFFLSAQRELPSYVVGKGNMSQVGGTATTVDVQINYSDESTDLDGTTIDNSCVLLFFNANDSKGYELPITTVVTPSPSNPVVRVSIVGFPALNGEISGTGVIYKKQNTYSLLPYVSGVSNSLQQILQESVARDIEVNYKDIQTYIGNGIPSNTLFTTDGYRVVMGSISPFPIYQWNGTSFTTLGGTEIAASNVFPTTPGTKIGDVFYKEDTKTNYTYAGGDYWFGDAIETTTNLSKSDTVTISGTQHFNYKNATVYNTLKKTVSWYVDGIGWVAYNKNNKQFDYTKFVIENAAYSDSLYYFKGKGTTSTFDGTYTSAIEVGWQLKDSMHVINRFQANTDDNIRLFTQRVSVPLGYSNYTTISGTFNTGSSLFHYTENTGDFVQYSVVTGNNATIQLSYTKNTNGGTWDVSIDGAAVSMQVDCYAASVSYNEIITVANGLSAGTHTVRITKNATSNASASTPTRAYVAFYDGSNSRWTESSFRTINIDPSSADFIDVANFNLTPFTSFNPSADGSNRELAVQGRPTGDLTNYPSFVSYAPGHSNATFRYVADSLKIFADGVLITSNSTKYNKAKRLEIVQVSDWYHPNDYTAALPSKVLARVIQKQIFEAPYMYLNENIEFKKDIDFNGFAAMMPYSLPYGDTLYVGEGKSYILEGSNYDLTDSPRPQSTLLKTNETGKKEFVTATTFFNDFTRKTLTNSKPFQYKSEVFIKKLYPVINGDNGSEIELVKAGQKVSFEAAFAWAWMPNELSPKNFAIRDTLLQESAPSPTYLNNPLSYKNSSSSSGGTGTLTGNGIATRIPFYDATTNFSNDNALKWDNVNKVLNVGNVTSLDNTKSLNTIGLNIATSGGVPVRMGSTSNSDFGVQYFRNNTNVGRLDLTNDVNGDFMQWSAPFGKGFSFTGSSMYFGGLSGARIFSPNVTANFRGVGTSNATASAQFYRSDGLAIARVQDDGTFVQTTQNANTVAVQSLTNNSGSVSQYVSSASPEGVITAGMGSVCYVTDGTIYLKTQNFNAIGWQLISSKTATATIAAASSSTPAGAFFQLSVPVTTTGSLNTSTVVDKDVTNLPAGVSIKTVIRAANSMTIVLESSTAFTFSSAGTATIKWN